MTRLCHVGGQTAARISGSSAVPVDWPVPEDDVRAAEAPYFPRLDAGDTFDELLAIAARLGLVARLVGAGEMIAQNGSVSLVISGSVGLLVEGSGLLATILEAGEVIGIETLAGVPPRFDAVWLSPGIVMDLPVDERWSAAASPRLAHWIGDTSGRLQHALAREISCCLEHPARTRLADLLCAMSQDGRLAKVIITQAQLARLVGCSGQASARLWKRSRRGRSPKPSGAGSKSVTSKDSNAWDADVCRARRAERRARRCRP